MMMTKSQLQRRIEMRTRSAHGSARGSANTLAPSPHPRRGFTLTELIAAIAIIVVIAGVTVVSVRNLAREARLSSATNAVVAALDTGRAMAIRDNTLVAVVFRVRLVGDNKQQIEIVTAKWTGETPLVPVGNASNLRAIDRFAPMTDVAPRRLPAGISIAAPLYHSSASDSMWDDVWGFASYLPTTVPGDQPTREPPGRVFAVIYSPDGRVLMRNPTSNSFRMFVDFNDDGLQQISACTVCNYDGQQGVLNYTNPPIIPNPFPGGMFNVQMMFQRTSADEPYVTAVPFLAVYNEDNFRSTYSPIDWDNDNWQLKHDQLTEFVNEHGERIHFNRYTGVVLR
jgi:prepilin-type N-terminal cleavage/methylation domain-containing protein